MAQPAEGSFWVNAVRRWHTCEKLLSLREPLGLKLPSGAADLKPGCTLGTPGKPRRSPRPGHALPTPPKKEILTSQSPYRYLLKIPRGSRGTGELGSSDVATTPNLNLNHSSDFSSSGVPLPASNFYCPFPQCTLAAAQASTVVQNRTIVYDKAALCLLTRGTFCWYVTLKAPYWNIKLIPTTGETPTIPWGNIYTIQG